MIISVASGKGGTGKTLISTNLALSLKDKNIQFLDCDVEEPNAFLFLKPEIKEEIPVEMLVPIVEEEKCTHCKKCAEFCEFSAILVSPNRVQIFPELCHSCGGCALVCETNAIKETPFRIGSVKKGNSSHIELVYGELEVSKPLAVPIIRKVKDNTDKNRLVIIDAPPGASDPVIASVKGSHFVILVTEPTPFGLHDLKIAVSVIKELQIPHGVVINRANIGNKDVYEFCKSNGIPILLEIPYDRHIAELYSRAIPIVEVMNEWVEKFQKLYSDIERMIAK
ncbi:ATP-binding protein [Caldisericum exile]|uniref:ATP-binding protein n=1 Tax=Caldisericum exile TaxID=693075 RepID=UPI003C718A3A